jgi:hypothetical protein
MWKDIYIAGRGKNEAYENSKLESKSFWTK